MGHRRWLEPDDPWKKHGYLLNGEVDKRGPPRKRSGTKIKMLLDDWEECPSPGKKKKAPEPLLRVWKTKYVVWSCCTGTSSTRLKALIKCISRRMSSRACLAQF